MDNQFRQNVDLEPLINGKRPPTLAGEARLVVLIEPHAFSRGCLRSWLGTLGDEFELAELADAASLGPDRLARACAVVLGGYGMVTHETWLEQQVNWLRANRPDAPILAIIDPDAPETGELLEDRLSVNGYLPWSSSLEIATAALRLVCVGGRYIPRIPRPSARPPEPDIRSLGIVPPLTAALTPSEFRVLELLGEGLANKVIAYRLGLSQSTVKVHIHSILSKLKVTNRTQAALVMRAARIRAGERGAPKLADPPGEAEPSSNG